jgi:HAD superfamily hydrolase (TIGR01484 family)
MTPGTPKLIVFDLDGTLSESKQPTTQVMGACIARLLSFIPVAVMSGANLPQFRTQFLQALPTDAELSQLYLFPVGAAECYRYKDSSWQQLYTHTFTPEEVVHIGAELGLGMEEAGIMESIPKIWGEQFEDRGSAIAFSLLGQRAPLEAKRAWHQNHDQLRVRLHAIMARRLPNLTITMGGLTTLDITRKGITKAYGVRELSRMTGIPLEEMLYIGDALQTGGNDAVVLETGIPTRVTVGPENTARIIEEMLKKLI